MNNDNIPKKAIVSVIMPVYNSERYLSESILSVLNQSFVNLELILINDGSTDSSGLICNDFEKNDNRVRVLHQKNHGISYTRNKGIEVSQGKYITFIDNDDIYHKTLLEENIKLLEQYRADIIKFGSITEVISYGEIKDIYYRRSKNLKVISKNGLKDEYKYLKANFLVNLVWDGIYKLAYINKHNIRFDESFYHGLDDQKFNLDLLIDFNSMIINPQLYYTWKRRVEHSTSFKFSTRKYLERHSITKYEIKFLEKLNYLDDEYINDITVESFFISLGYVYARNSKIKRKLRIKYIKEIIKLELYSALISKAQVKYLIKKKRKSFLIIYLINNKRFISVDILMKVYSFLKNKY